MVHVFVGVRRKTTVDVQTKTDDPLLPLQDVEAWILARLLETSRLQLRVDHSIPAASIAPQPMQTGP